MADKILKSITFPGLPDKYLIPQGMNTQATYLFAENLDEFTESGFYYCEDCFPLPAESRHGFLFISGQGTNYDTSTIACAQLYIGAESPDGSHIHSKAGIYARTMQVTEGTLGVGPGNFTEWEKLNEDPGHVIGTEPTTGNLVLSNVGMTSTIAENTAF